MMYLVITMSTCVFLRFIGRNYKPPRRFEEIDPGVLHTCSMCSCRALHESFYFFFSLEVYYHGKTYFGVLELISRPDICSFYSAGQ